MTIKEAIIHAEEVADRCAITDGNIQCEDEHRQLAQWLKELERYRTAVPAARAYIEALKKFPANDDFFRAVDNTLEIMDNAIKWVDEVKE